MEDNPLDLVPTDELFDELARRFSAVALCTLHDKSTQAEASRFYYAGGQLLCIGLLEGSKARLLNEYVSNGTTEP